MNYNEQFYDLYKTLEHAISRKLPKKVKSPIVVYMNTLPSNRSGQLEQMRNYRNMSPGHGVGAKPIVPYEWIIILKKEIQYVDCGGVAMERRLVESMNRFYARKKSARDNSKPNLQNPTTTSRPNNQKSGATSSRPTVQNAPKPRTSTSTSTSIGQINQSHRFCDKEHNFSIDLQINKGQGRVVKKAPFSSTRTQMVDISVYFDYCGKLTDYSAFLLTKNGPKSIKLKRGENKLQIPASDITANMVKVKLAFEYKVGVFTTKKDAMTVGRNV